MKSRLLCALLMSSAAFAGTSLIYVSPDFRNPFTILGSLSLAGTNETAIDTTERDLWHFETSLSPEEAAAQLSCCDLAHTPFRLSPQQALQQIAARPGAITAAHFEPSLRRQALARIEAFSPQERENFEEALTEEIKISDLKKLAAAAPQGQSPASPETAHGPLGAFLAGGQRTGEAFGELRLRLGLHDLLDPDSGLSPFSEIRTADLSLRFGTESHFGVERFDLIAVTALPPLNYLESPPSWRLRAGFERLDESFCVDCHAVRLDGGIGVASPLARVLVYAFVSPTLDFSTAFTHGYRLMPTFEEGLLFAAADFKGQISADVAWDAFQRSHSQAFATLGAQIACNFLRNYGLRLAWRARFDLDGPPATRSEASLGLQAHF